VFLIQYIFLSSVQHHLSNLSNQRIANRFNLSILYETRLEVLIFIFSWIKCFKIEKRVLLLRSALRIFYF